MRQAGTPIEITDEVAIRLRRLNLTERDFAESWMQKLIHDNPSLLPVDDLRPSTGPLVSLGREVSTPAGPIDNLFVDPDGTLVIVETKLWRNPQARREVVGQILDYAASLSRFDFDKLNEAVRSASGGRGIVDLVGVDADSSGRLIDGIARSLRTGDFLLLVVGDGIREGVEGMADLLAGSPHLGFTFGLIELAVYESSAGATVVVPTVVAHSVEITRATVRVEAQSDGRLDVHVAAVGQDGAEGRTSSKKLNESAFDSQLRQAIDPAIFDELTEWRGEVERDPRMRVDYATASMIFRIKPSNIAREFTGLVIKPNGLAGVGYLCSQIEKTGAPVGIAERFARDTAELVGAAVPRKAPDTWGDGTGGSDWVAVADILDHREEFTGLMRRVADELEAALDG